VNGGRIRRGAVSLCLAGTDAFGTTAWAWPGDAGPAPSIGLPHAGQFTRLAAGQFHDYIMATPICAARTPHELPSAPAVRVTFFCRFSAAASIQAHKIEKVGMEYLGVWARVRTAGHCRICRISGIDAVCHRSPKHAHGPYSIPRRLCRNELHNPTLECTGLTRQIRQWERPMPDACSGSALGPRSVDLSGWL